MRCDGCKFWKPEGDRELPPIGQLGVCRKAIYLPDALAHINGDAEKFPSLYADRKIKNLDGQKLFVNDIEGYNALMLTAPDFFCAHFDAAEPRA